MLLLMNILGIFVFLGVAYLFSRDRKNIKWRSVGVILVIQLILSMKTLKLFISIL